MDKIKDFFRSFTVIEWCIAVAVLTMVLAIAAPALFGGQKQIRHDASEGWTYVTQTRYGDEVYMKHFPDKHITIYSTWRAMSVVKD